MCDRSIFVPRRMGMVHPSPFPHHNAAIKAPTCYRQHHHPGGRARVRRNWQNNNNRNQTQFAVHTFTPTQEWTTPDRPEQLLVMTLLKRISSSELILNLLFRGLFSFEGICDILRVDMPQVPGQQSEACPPPPPPSPPADFLALPLSSLL